MKKLLLIFVALIGMIGATSCNESKSVLLETVIEEVSEECPFEVELGMVCYGISDDGYNLVYHIDVDEDIHDDVSYMGFSIAEKEALIEEMAEDEEMLMLLDILESLDKGLVYELKGDITGNVNRLEISASIIRNVLNSI